jgi:hypothetical protein
MFEDCPLGPTSLRHTPARGWERADAYPCSRTVRVQEVPIQAKTRISRAVPVGILVFFVCALAAVVWAPLGAVASWIGPGSETEYAKLTASDGKAGDGLGWSVALTGDTALVSSLWKNSGRGAAYVFTRSGGTWTRKAMLTASDGTTQDVFGVSSALSSDTALVGASGKNSGRGAAYVFTRSGSTWTQQAELTASDGTTGDDFCESVAISGDTALVGAPRKNSGCGAAYVFRRSGSTWTQEATMTASDGTSESAFGSSAALSGDTALLGAPGNYDYTQPDENYAYRGAAYVFRRSGNTWTQEATLTASDGWPGDDFGWSAALSGDTALIGAIGSNGLSGAAYVFTRSGNAWTQQAELTASDARVPWSDSGAGSILFGWSAALSGDTALAGALGVGSTGGPAGGGAYVFRRLGITWMQEAKLTPSDGLAGGDFGWSAALSGDTALVGDSVKNSERGAAYAFDITAPVASVLTRPVMPARVARGRYFTTYGYVSPKVGGRMKVYFFRKVGRRWVYWRWASTANRVISPARSRYALRCRMPFAGRWRAKAYFPGERRVLPGWSPARDFSVR